ncbi:hypothetical protein HW132_02045 [Brasilonema sp. CT11]|nr:hypothetical protein [Brasilonema sp. CT11]
MTRLKFAEVEEILTSKGYLVEKTSSGYKSQGHRFKNLTELKEWALGLPSIVQENKQETEQPQVQPEAEPTRFDGWDRQGLWGYLGVAGIDRDALFETKDGWVFDRDKAIAALVAYEYSQGCANEPYHDSSREECEEDKEEEVGSLEVNPTVKFAHTWAEVKIAVKAIASALMGRNFAEAFTIRDFFVPCGFRKLARSFLKRHYLIKIQAKCHSFAEMVKVSRLIVKLA